jgi:hypothetical protein
MDAYRIEDFEVFDMNRAKLAWLCRYEDQTKKHTDVYELNLMSTLDHLMRKLGLCSGSWEFCCNMCDDSKTQRVMYLPLKQTSDLMAIEQALDIGEQTQKCTVQLQDSFP